MRAKRCSECGRWAEPPLCIGHAVLPDEVRQRMEAQGMSPAEYVWCRECIDRLKAEREEFEQMERDVAAGTLCAVCMQEMDPPGGYAVASPDGTRLSRLCASCRGGAESHRRKQQS